MDCKHVAFSGHAIRRMFERAIPVDDVEEVVQTGQVIAEYPDDIPHPSVLLLGFVRGQPLHVVVGVNTNRSACVIITACRPDVARWHPDFRTRR